MIYIIGTVGFIAGFVLGQILLMRWLKEYSKEELLENKDLHWKYGFFNWVVAIVTSASSVWLYRHFILG
jgi:hypothetical protein